MEEFTSHRLIKLVAAPLLSPILHSIALSAFGGVDLMQD
jgi:hypothetical protein